MNILITGCAGFIGSNLAEFLINRGYKIVGLDNFDDYYARCIKEENLKNIESSKFFKFYEGDIRDENVINQIFDVERIDVVIHLAAKAGVRQSMLYPEEYFSVNVNGTKNILDSMNEYKIKKFIFASSSSVYGDSKIIPFRENQENLKQLSPYAESKYECEKLIERYSKQYKINSICLRLFTVYGERQRPDLAICKFTKSILNDAPITVYGDGLTSRDYTHIDDIIEGFASALKYDKTPFEVINLGSSNPIMLSELLKLLENACDKKAIIENRPIPKCDMTATYADITKAQELLNYHPKVSFEKGLTQFVEYFKAGIH